MNEEACSLFLQTIDVDSRKRNEAERILMEKEKDPVFVMSLIRGSMMDTNAIVKRVSSLYFKNAIINQWNNDAYALAKNRLIEEILDMFLYGDDVTRVSYNAILVHIFNKEKSLDRIEVLFEKASQFLKVPDVNHVYTALNMYSKVFEADEIRSNIESALEKIYGGSGRDILGKVHMFFEMGDYVMLKVGLNVLVKSYCYYSIPKYLSCIEAFSYVFGLALRTMGLENNEVEGVLDCKELAANFIYREYSKGLKKFYKNNELSEYVKDVSRLREVYPMFLKVVQERSKLREEIEVCAVDFFALLVSDATFNEYVERDIPYLVFGYILPVYSLSEADEEDFEQDAEKYLREKYGYFRSTLRSNLNGLFREIVSKMKNNEEKFNEMLKCLVSVLDNCKENPSKENLRMAYGSFFLLASIKSTLMKKAMNVLVYVVMNHVIPNLRGECLVLKSQACYFLSIIEEDLPIGTEAIGLLDEVHALMMSSHRVLYVEATLAMSFFMSNEMASEKFKQLIPVVLESILRLLNAYDLEPLTILLDTITEYYPEEMVKYAPELVRSISGIVITHLSSTEELSEEKAMLVMGFLRNIESLILSLEHGSVVLEHAYMNSYDVLYFILNEGKEDFYQEMLDILNGYVFMIKRIERSMWGLFHMVLNLPIDDIAIYSSNVADLIDNFVTYGKESVMNTSILTGIYSVISKFCLCNEENFYEDEFMDGCRIIESIILNIGNEVVNADPSRLEFFLNVAISGLSMVDEAGTAMVYVLEVVMNSFILRPNDTIRILVEHKRLEEILRNLFTQRNNFKRVHDKKICMLFIGAVCGLRDGEIPGLDMQGFIGFIVAVVTSLPAAIKLRNQMKEEEDEEVDESYCEEEEYASSDGSYGDVFLEEDIYFETSLDHFEPFGYISSILSQPMPGSYASRAVHEMSEKQKSTMFSVLNTERVIQKV
ncbi:importin [Ordospora colligata]|nr:importin [Ordospora colligata]